jgi:hypothetical protein
VKHFGVHAALKSGSVFERFGDKRIGIGLEVCFCRRSTVESATYAVHCFNRSLLSDDKYRARSIPLTDVPTVIVGAPFASTSWDFRHRQSTGCRVLGVHMENSSQPGKGVPNTQGSPSRWVQWATLRPTQGAIGYAQVEEKKSSYRELKPEKRRSFAEEHAIAVVLGPSGALHVVDHHHWARAWFDMGFPEAPLRMREDFSGLTDEQFVGTMSERGWLHAFDEHGREFNVSDLPRSIESIPDDVFQSVAAFIRIAGVFKNPGEFNAKFAWADFFRQRVATRPSTVDGFALMLAEAFAASRLPEAKALPGYISAGGAV